MDKFEAKKKYADWLDKEGSVLAQSARERQNIFKLRNSGVDQFKQ